MEIVTIILGFVIAYLLGSVPTAVWFGKANYGIDVREHGSGNPGATNTFRVLGKKAGIIVMLVDIAKGLMATAIATLLVTINLLPDANMVTFQLLFGITAVLGHIFPVFISFKGGKGVATFLGGLLAAAWPIGLIAIAIWIGTALLFKMSSLAALWAAGFTPIVAYYMGYERVAIMAAALAIIIYIRHKDNIIRIAKGEESKIGQGK